MQPNASDDEEMTWCEVANWTESFGWNTLFLWPLLYWINGGAVSSDQATTRILLLSFAGVSAVGITAWKKVYLREESKNGRDAASDC